MARKKKPEFFVATREDLGELLHTALRKYCDSTPTSIAWNVINLLDRQTWGEYLDVVWKALESSAKQTEGQIAYALRKGSVQDWHIMANYPGVTLHCAFKLFSRADWFSYGVLLYSHFTEE